jgi:hypothetical protein
MQVLDEQKMHIQTLEQERAELIDTKADFMSEKINEIVNREVHKELQKIKGSQQNQSYEDNGEGEDSEGYDEEAHVEHRQQHPQGYHPEMEEYEDENQSQYSQMSQSEHSRRMNMGYGSGVPSHGPNKENKYMAGHYPEDYESVASQKYSQSDSRVSSKDSSVQNKVYDRRLPPNVEEMLKQKRQQMANNLAKY